MAVGRYEQAIPLLTRAGGLDPDDPEIKCDLALALMHSGRLSDADMAAHRAIATAPLHERSYRVRSLILQKGGRARDAVQLANEAVRLDPTNPSAFHVLAQALSAAGDNQHAWQAAMQMVALAPGNSDSHQLVGLVAIRLKLWGQAEKASREALRLDPTDWAAMNNLGVALRGQGRKAEAVQAYERAAQMNASSATPRDNLVQAVLPVQSAGADILRMVLVPWLIPVYLIKWAVGWRESRTLRAKLSLGSREYYRRETGSGATARMGPREYGFLWAILTFVIISLPLVFVLLGLDSVNPGGIAINDLVALCLWVGIPVATGLFFAQRRSARK